MIGSKQRRSLWSEVSLRLKKCSQTAVSHVIGLNRILLTTATQGLSDSRTRSRHIVPALSSVCTTCVDPVNFPERIGHTEIMSSTFAPLASRGPTPIILKSREGFMCRPPSNFFPSVVRSFRGLNGAISPVIVEMLVLLMYPMWALICCPHSDGGISFCQFHPNGANVRENPSTFLISE